MEIKMSPGGMPTEQGDYNFGYMWMFEDFIVQASPEIREEIKKRVEKAIISDERWHKWARPHVDWIRAVDLGDAYKGWGPNYLYVWLNSENIPFYAGQSKDRDRAGHFTSSTRSEKFKDVVRKGGCHAVVVAKHLPDSKINDLEQGLIRYFKWKDYPIVNDKGLPSQTECSMAKKLAESGSCSMEQVFLDETEYANDFAKIFAVLDEAASSEWTGECAVLLEKQSCRA